MATASPVLPEDQFTCSICLELFTEPTSTPCGHNFCYACIVRHWEGKEQCKCPLCNETLDRGLKFCVNTGFKEVVENFKKHLETADKHSPVKPGEVACDCCVGNTSRASKTCWVCLTSYCETHLEPHQRVASLKTHKLTNPVRNLEDKICKKHNRILELCCRNDLSRVCVLCAGNSDHDSAPLRGAYLVKRAQVVEETVEVAGKCGKRAKKRKVAVQTEKKGKSEALANNVEPNYVSVPYISFPNEGPHLLNTYFHLPENMGISQGKFYYEVETKGRRSWLIGLVRESGLRKGRLKLNTRDGNWVIQVENTNCTVLLNVHLNLLLTRTPERVTVFVDYDKGLVTFYDDYTNVIYTFTGCKFKERICLFYLPAGDPRWAVGPQECKNILLAFFFLMFAIYFISRGLR